MLRVKGKLIREMHDNYVVIGLETTGLSPRYDNIIEFVGIKVSKGKIIDELSLLIKPFYPVSSFISKFTGITNEMLEDKPAITDVIDTIVDFIGDSIILGYNTYFDINFIYDNLKELRNIDFCNDYIDLLSVTRKIYPHWNDYKLSTIAKKLKTKIKPNHRARNDCLATLEAYKICKKHMYRNGINYKSLFKNNYLEPLNYNSTSNKQKDNTTPLYKKTVVFTGNLSKLSKKDATQVVVDNGGKLGKSVNSNTDYLVMGDFDYAKIHENNKCINQQKAEELILNGADVMILTENVFFDFIGISTYV